jgi:3-deoxy-D-manno-octulosonate 8-phosphate phosphatase KdsC-like HAD superfamily phosphatase
VAVASAHDVVRGAARAVTTVPGGDGAIREIASWILGPSLDVPDFPDVPVSLESPTITQPE